MIEKIFQKKKTNAKANDFLFHLWIGIYCRKDDFFSSDEFIFVIFSVFEEPAKSAQFLKYCHLYTIHVYEFKREEFSNELLISYRNGRALKFEHVFIAKVTII